MKKSPSLSKLHFPLSSETNHDMSSSEKNNSSLLESGTFLPTNLIKKHGGGGGGKGAKGPVINEMTSKVYHHPAYRRIQSKAVLFLGLWYFFSACTLFLNKYIVAYIDGDATILGCSQMLVTLVLGYIQMYYPLGMYDRVIRKEKPPNFYRNMIIVGSLRYLTVLLGLIALDYVEVSFTETVKSSAPAFTVIISYFMVGEYTGIYVKLSLIPVMGGLALCSANELNFHIIGFAAALGTNISECLQNVYSKMLISGTSTSYSPGELQFYTCLASLGIQLPIFLWMEDLSNVGSKLNKDFIICCLMNGIFFHFQTISAYVLMDFITPVTHSVANTAKRALLIMLSIVLFGNSVTFLSGLGTTIVIIGVVLYNKAKEIDRKQNLNNVLLKTTPKVSEF